MVIENPDPENLSPGDEVTVEVGSFDQQFRTRTRLQDKTLVVPGVIPGETVRCEITGTDRGSLTGRPVKIIDPDPDRVEPNCRYFGKCAGCQLQHIEPDRQLQLKHNHLRDCMERYSNISSEPLEQIIPSSETYGYRNNITIHGPGEPGFWSVGGNRIIPIEKCSISLDDINRELAEFRQSPPPEVTGEPAEDILFRASSTGETYVGPEQDAETNNHWLNEELNHPLQEGSIELSVPTHGFWQANTPMLPRLVREVVSRVDKFQPSHLIEAYAGMGLFSIFSSPVAEHITAIELNPQAVEAGRRNVRNLDISNIRFIESDTESALDEILWETPSNNSTLLVDPPREGMTKPVRDTIISHPPEQLIYVSCNPDSFARDLDQLCRNTYRLESVIGIDMFPQTHHLECLGQLTTVSD